MKRNQGFTLLELMIVVAVIGIIAAIALPQYKSYVLRGRLAAPQSTLMAWAGQMEQYYQDNRYYNSDGGSSTTTCGGSTTFQPANTTYFTYGCTSTLTSYTLTATSAAKLNGGSAGDYTYTLDQSGNQATTKWAGTAASLTCFSNSGSC